MSKNNITRGNEFMRIFKNGSGCAILLTGLFFSCGQNTFSRHAFYLNPAGDDSNSGTRERPWKTIDQLNKTNLKAGDTVYFEGAQVFDGSIILDSNKHGLPGQPIVITSEGGGQARIRSGRGTALSLNRTSHVEILGLSFTGDGRKEGNQKDGVVIANSSDVRMDSISIQGYQKAGLLVLSSSEINIRNVYAHDNGFAGIYIIGEHSKEDCKNIYIGYCKVENNPGDPAILDNHSGNGILAGFCKNVLIEYSVATNNGWDMPRTGNGPVGIWAYEADSVVIQHCISYRNKTSPGGGDGGGFDLDGGTTHSLIQYCLSFENQGSGFGIFQYAGASNWHDNTIRFNISVNDGNISPAGASVFIWNSSRDNKQFKNCYFYNNTIYNDSAAAISYDGQSEHAGFYFYNNIFEAGDKLIKGKENSSVFFANDWYSIKGGFNCDGFRDFRQWAKSKKREQVRGILVGLNINPGFANPGKSVISSPAELKYFDKYRIPGNSVLRTRGLDLEALYGLKTGKEDFLQKTAPLNGIGACF